MPSFAEVHAKAVVSELTMFDRMIFKGHVTRFFHSAGSRRSSTAKGCCSRT